MSESLTREQRAFVALAEMVKEDAEFADRFYYPFNGIYLYDYENVHELLSRWGKLARKHGAHTRKDFRNAWACLVFDFSDEGNQYSHIGIYVSRESVCTKKVVGTKEVEQIDYKNAPKITVTEEVVEWECSPMLSAAADEAS